MEKVWEGRIILLYHATTIKNITSVWEGVQRSCVNYSSGKDGDSLNSETRIGKDRIVLNDKKRKGNITF